MPSLSAFPIRKLVFFNARFVGFLTRKTCYLAYCPMVFQFVNVWFLRCELFAKRTGYGRVYVSGGML